MMGMERLTLQNFRNYGEQEIRLDPGCNVICGGNAEGKTNLLEAVCYLTQGRSQRARSDRELIRFNEEAARLTGVFRARGREFLVEADLRRGQRRKLRVNRVPVKTSAALADVSASVFFCPEDLQLVREGAAARRKFLDTALCQLRPRYAAALADYRKCHEHKTRILRDSGEKPELLSMLPDFNERMIRSGAVLIRCRALYIERLAEHAAVRHRECSGARETLDVRYQTVSTVTDPAGDVQVLLAQLREHMEKHAQAELASGQCLSGPHKDDLLLFINGQDARVYASQGQARTAALCLKLAEREIFRSALGECPILLLDDVLSELDPQRQEYVLNCIRDGQVLITCCEDDRLARMLRGQVLHVKQGRVLPAGAASPAGAT